MITIKAGPFVRALHHMGFMRGIPVGIEATGNKFSDDPIHPVSRDALLDHIEKSRPEVLALGARLTVVAMDRLARHLRDTEDFSNGDVENLCEQIESRLFDELALTTVIAVDQEHTAYLDTTKIDPNISAKFPLAVFDLDEAKKCLAFGLSTAAVFHLMRVVELALRAVHSCLSIPVQLTGNDRNWGQIVNRIRQNVKERGAFLERDLFQEIYALLDSIKDAWRNGTMHVEKKYTDEEAKDIYMVVNAFMRKIALRMDENGLPLV